MFGIFHFLKSSLKEDTLKYKAENRSSLQNPVMTLLIPSSNWAKCLEGLQGGTHTAEVVSAAFFSLNNEFSGIWMPLLCLFPSTPRVTIAPLVPSSFVSQMEMLLWMVPWSLSN